MRKTLAKILFATALLLGVSIAAPPGHAAVTAAPAVTIPGSLVQTVQYYAAPRYYGRPRYYARRYYGPRRYYARPRYFGPRPGYYARRGFYR